MKIERALAEDLDEIVNVLDEATLKLLDEGNHQWKYPWYKDEVRKELDFQYSVKKRNRIMAVFTIRPLGKNNFKAEAGEKDYYLYHVAILPEFQGKGIEREILRFVKKLCKNHRINIYLDCDAGNEKLRRFYKKEGFYEQGNYLQKDVLVSVYRFLHKDTPSKNRLKNLVKRRKREIRIFRKAVLAMLAVVLFINLKTIINFFDHGIPLTPAIVVGEYTYWYDKNFDKDRIPKDVSNVGGIEKILYSDQWPVQPLEAVGIPKGMVGEMVYLSDDQSQVYVYDRKQLKYLTFLKEYTIKNNNYSNGIYEELLKSCAQKDTVPLDKIPADYSFEQAKKDKLIIMYRKNNSLAIEGEEYFDAFLRDTQKKGNFHVRIAQMLEGMGNIIFDVFYYKKSYYFFSSNDPDMRNARYSYLIEDKLPFSNGPNYTIYMLSRDDTMSAQEYMKNQGGGSSLLIFMTDTQKE